MKSFIQSIKDIDPHNLSDQLQAPFLRLVATLSMGEILLPITSDARLLTKAEVQELILELQKYCDFYEGSTVELYNSQVAENNDETD